MKYSDFTVHIIEPSNNGWLTQNYEVPIYGRIFSDKIFLGVTDSIENWVEITQEQYEAYQAELEEYNNSLKEE